MISTAQLNGLSGDSLIVGAEPWEAVTMGKPILVHPPFWTEHRRLGDKLQHLATLSPEDVKAIEVLVDDVLQRRMWQLHDTLLVRYFPKAKQAKAH